MLPIHALRPAFEAALDAGPVVVQAPTGSGKSTEIPRWCLARGRVLVVEPRRVACRSLAERVAGLEGTPLGDRVGYRVRDDDRSGGATRLLYATPGVVLRMLADDALAGFETVIVDELHERTLDVDLVLALCRERVRAALVVMSATLDSGAVAGWLQAADLRGEGRTFPVDHRYLGEGSELPDGRGLTERVAAALARVDHPGDVLVFLPGKAEIARVEQGLRGRRELGPLTILPLHGGLSLDEQRAAFGTTPHRKVVLATNVAETSVTLPGIGVVIDSGLVRRTRYHDGRGYLTLLPVAEDQADQRAGRAGRTGPGLCLRLWGARARLDARTPPEVYRESLVPLVLAAAACGARVDRLPFLDPPRGYAPGRRPGRPGGPRGPGRRRPHPAGARPSSAYPSIRAMGACWWRRRARPRWRTWWTWSPPSRWIGRSSPRGRPPPTRPMTCGIRAVTWWRRSGRFGRVSRNAMDYERLRCGRRARTPAGYGACTGCRRCPGRVSSIVGAWRWWRWRPTGGWPMWPGTASARWRGATGAPSCPWPGRAPWRCWWRRRLAARWRRPSSSTAAPSAATRARRRSWPPARCRCPSRGCWRAAWAASRWGRCGAKATRSSPRSRWCTPAACSAPERPSPRGRWPGRR
ncbi:MAG: helicase-related protein [bacterium]